MMSFFPRSGLFLQERDEGNAGSSVPRSFPAFFPLLLLTEFSLHLFSVRYFSF